MKPLLPFEKLPKELGFNKKITYCTVDISGIQSYIFSSIDRYTTPEEICNRSGFVEHITRYIHHKLSKISGYLFGSASSGKLLCAFRTSVNEDELCKTLNTLQRSVFASTEGKLTFYYAICQAKCVKEQAFNRENDLHASAQISTLLEKEKLHCLNLLGTDMQKDKKEELIPSFAPVNLSDAAKDMAVVKLDLDNLGVFFRDIITFDRRHRVSVALDETIHNCLTADKRIHLLFAGGDDILFLCPMSDYLSVVSDFFRRLKIMMLENPNLSDYAQNHFGISAGICTLRKSLDNIPMQAYLENVEDALATAKTKGNKNCVFILLPCKEQLYIRWDDFCFLSDIFQRIKEPLLSQHRFSDSDFANINLLTDQIIILAKHQRLLTRKEQNRLYEIKKLSV